jgi:cell wall-associated NlpC family hydrolase
LAASGDHGRLVALALAAGSGLLALMLGVAGLAGVVELAQATPPSAQALADIPADYLGLFVAAAATCPGLSWSVPAAIAKIESDFGRSTAPGVTSGTNVAGAAGPMQLGVGGAAGPTFSAYDHPVAADPAPTPPGGASPPSPYDPVDAVYAAVRDLCANGAADPARLHAAVWAYNHSDAYVTRVLALAASYQGVPDGAAGPASSAIRFALGQLGTPYRWGGEGAGGFDCSGLVQAAYAAAGIALPRTAQSQFDAGPPLPSADALQPGDLVFFGAAPDEVTHVGIVVGNGEMVDAPHTGAVVRVEPYAWTDYLGATRPVGSQQS